MDYVIYTDGSSNGRQGNAGSAAVIFQGDKGLLVAEPIEYDTGNNVAELHGILIGIRELPYRAKAQIITDSNNCIMWLSGDWNRNNPQVKAVADEIDSVWQEKDLDLSFLWVRGHSKNRWNDFADKAAKTAKTTKRKVREEITYE